MAEADERTALREHYGRVLDEYRFQVDLNWKRSQYLFILNLAVLVAATSLLSSANPRAELVAALYAVGVLLAAVSVHTNHVQHRYYRRTREVKRRTEEALELGDLALETTPGMREPSSGWRPLRVRHTLTFVLGVLGVADLVGLGLIACLYF